MRLKSISYYLKYFNEKGNGFFTPYNFIVNTIIKHP